MFEYRPISPRLLVIIPGIPINYLANLPKAPEARLTWDYHQQQYTRVLGLRQFGLTKMDKGMQDGHSTPLATEWTDIKVLSVGGVFRLLHN